MHTFSVSFTHLATVLGMVDLFKPAVESLYSDRMTGAAEFGADMSWRARVGGRERFYAHLPLVDGAVTLLSIVEEPIPGAESLNPSRHTLIVTVPDRVEAATIAGQILDLLGPETIDEPRGNATPFELHEHCQAIARRDAADVVGPAGIEPATFPASRERSTN